MLLSESQIKKKNDKKEKLEEAKKQWCVVGKKHGRSEVQPDFDTGKPKMFSSKDQAEWYADEIRSMTKDKTTKIVVRE